MLLCLVWISAQQHLHSTAVGSLIPIFAMHACADVELRTIIAFARMRETLEVRPFAQVWVFSPTLSVSVLRLLKCASDQARQSI